MTQVLAKIAIMPSVSLVMVLMKKLNRIIGLLEIPGDKLGVKWDSLEF